MINNLKQQFGSIRWTPLSRDDVFRSALMAVIIGMVFMVFHLQGNTTDIHAYGRSVLSWMVARWNDIGGEYSHGWLIPLVSAWLVWRKRRELALAPKQVCWWGLAVLVLALLLHWVGAKAQQTRLSLVSLIMIIWGIPFFLYGKRVAGLLLFPCAYLVFCIPLNFLDTATAPLRITAAAVSAAILNGLGLEVTRIGAGISSSAAQGFHFDVAPECSGLHSLLAMTALMAAYANLTQDRQWKKWLLFMCSIPVALVGNIVRITLIALIAAGFGQEVAMNLWHDYSGYPIFIVGILLMIGLGSLFSMDYGAWWTQWKKDLLSPTS